MEGKIHGEKAIFDRCDVGEDKSFTPRNEIHRQGRASLAEQSRSIGRDFMGATHRSPLGGFTGRISQPGNLLAKAAPVGRGRCLAGYLASVLGGTGCQGDARLGRSISRRQLCSRQRGGEKVGKTKRGKGTKWMVVVDGQGLPLGSQLTSASPGEVTLGLSTLEAIPIAGQPQRLIADKAYDSDPFREDLAERGIELVCPHRANRKRKKTQDGRKLRRYRKRWKVERTFAWLGRFRRLVVRYERDIVVYNAFFHLACCFILLRWL